MSVISIILVVLIAFLAGIEGILDEFQFHQPLIACTLIGLVTGNLTACIILGGTLQMIALGWANIGAAVAPDAALASVASAIILVLGGQGVAGIPSAIAIAIPLAVAGLFLTMIVRTLAVPIVHLMDRAAEKREYTQRRVVTYFSNLYARCSYRDSSCSTFIHSSRQRSIFLRSNASLVNRWYGYRWRNGSCRWLCTSYQHDGY